jgi:hypothetical protein
MSTTDNNIQEVKETTAPSLYVIPDKPCNAKTLAWIEALKKGSSLCWKEGHRGDSDTLQDIAVFLTALSVAKPVEIQPYVQITNPK